MATRREFLSSTITGAAAASHMAAKAIPDSNVLTLRTHEWFGDNSEQFEFPKNWRLVRYDMKGVGAPALTKDQIREAIQHPLGTKRLQEIAAGKKTAAIVFDDLSQPTPTYAVVRYVIEELRSAGLRDENILFIAGHGCHYQMNGLEAAKKLGPETVQHHPWINHNIWENHADLGVTKAGNHLGVNTYCAKADVKITLSGLRAQSTPGYDGGPAMILPGVASMRSIRYMCEEIKRARRPGWDPDGTEIFYVWENEQRQDMIEAARRLPVDFSVQIVYGHERQPVRVFAGDIVKAHHEAARFAVDHLATDHANGADIVVVNAYPQGAHLQEHLSWGNRGLNDGGSVLVINQNPMGELAWDYLDESQSNKGGSYFTQRDARKPRFPSARQVILYSQYLQARELSPPYFPPEAIGLRKWDDVIESLAKVHQGDPTVAVYPYAGIQHGIARLDLPEGV